MSISNIFKYFYMIVIWCFVKQDFMRRFVIKKRGWQFIKDVCSSKNNIFLVMNRKVRKKFKSLSNIKDRFMFFFNFVIMLRFIDINGLMDNIIVIEKLLIR